MIDSRKYTIRNKLGMHARAATTFVQTANRFQCEVSVRKDDIVVNGKSIMGVLQLAACMGQEIEVEVDGEDGPQALTAFQELIEDKFGEEE